MGQNLNNTLIKIQNKLYDKVLWIVGGSGALLIHGLDVTPNDIDIIVDKKHYKKALKLMKPYIINDVGGTNHSDKKHFVIDGIEGEILCFSLNKENIDYRTFENTVFPVNKLEIEYGFYAKRTDKKEANQLKMKLIEQELARRKELSE